MKSRTGLGLALALALAMLGSEAHAAGDGSLGLALTKEGRGIQAAAFGIGLGGRLTNGTTAPVTTADIDVTGLPSGAVIEHAFLYWVTYGAAANLAITLDGTPTTGTLIGTHSGTCWVDFPALTTNFTARADVTAKVTGNKKYTLTGFPSGAPTADTQGATLFVVYRDPAVALNGGVILHDGALSVSGASATGAFTGLALPTTLLSARFMLGVGDGQLTLGDGSLVFGGVQMPIPAGGHWIGSAGSYWDNRSYDVLARFTPPRTSVGWAQNFAQDCLVFAYSALTFQSPEGTTSSMDAGAGGTVDAGGASNDGGGTAPSGDVGGPGSGSGPSDGGTAGSNDAQASDGCGCISGSPSSHAPTAAVLATAFLVSLARRRRRRSA